MIWLVCTYGINALVLQVDAFYRLQVEKIRQILIADLDSYELCHDKQRLIVLTVTNRTGLVVSHLLLHMPKQVEIVEISEIKAPCKRSTKKT